MTPLILNPGSIARSVTICYVPLDGAEVVINRPHDHGQNIYEFPENSLTPRERAEWCDKIMSNPAIVVTRCPYIISCFNRDYVYVVHPDGSKTKTEFNTFGSDVEFIASKLFNYSASFGMSASKTIGRFKKRMLDDEDPVNLIKEVYDTLGDSAERVYLIGALRNKRDGSKAHEVVKDPNTRLLEAARKVRMIEMQREQDEEEHCAGGATYGLGELNAAVVELDAAIAALSDK